MCFFSPYSFKYINSNQAMKQKHAALQRELAGTEKHLALGEQDDEGSSAHPVPGEPPRTPRNSPTTRGIPRTPDPFPATQPDASSESDVEPHHAATKKDGYSNQSPVNVESPLKAIPREGWGQGFTPESDESPLAKRDGYGTPSPQNKALILFKRLCFFSEQLYPHIATVA